jgi:hypothetical protein
MCRLFIDNPDMSAEEKREIYAAAHAVLIPFAGGGVDAHGLWIHSIYEVSLVAPSANV